MAHKIGAIPFQISGDKIAVLFVTSQRRGRWILPKGDLKAGEGQKKGCKREAFEEAGVQGKVLKNFPITLPIGKSSGNAITRVPVTYYPLLVTEQMDSWPESSKRERHWALLEDVARVTDRDDMRQLMMQFETLRHWIQKAAEHKKSKLTDPPTPAL